MFNDDAHGKKITERYEDLSSRIRSNAVENPDAILSLGSGDVAVIAEYMSFKADLTDINNFLSAEYAQDFFLADTFLYDKLLVSRTFNVAGYGSYSGGEINYIGVGAMAGRYGYNKYQTAALVAGWNSTQLIFGGGKHNFNQIKTGGAWARYGLKHYNNR